MPANLAMMPKGSKPKVTSSQLVADAMREVAKELNNAWVRGDISSTITLATLTETLLAIADKLDK